MKNKKLTISFVFLCFCAFVFACSFVSVTQAQTTDQTVDAAIDKIETIFPGEITNVTEEESAQVVIGKIIKIILGLVGIIALGIFLYGGIIWMTAGGNTKKAGTSRDILIWAALGLAVIFASYVAVDYILRAIAN